MYVCVYMVHTTAHHGQHVEFTGQLSGVSLCFLQVEFATGFYRSAFISHFSSLNVLLHLLKIYLIVHWCFAYLIVSEL